MRPRTLFVPVAAYLVLALVLPLAHGAARRDDFVKHAGWVLGGCAIVIGIAAAGGALFEAVRWFITRGGRP